MLRSIYILLLRLHPAVFRERFGDEMLDIAENAVGFRAKAMLLFDGLQSLLRQWVLRSEFRRPPLAVATPDSSANLPLFLTIDPYKPRPAALIHGGLASMAILCAVVMAIGHGGKARWFVIGAHRPGPSVVEVDRESIAETSLNTTVSVTEPKDPRDPMASLYFKIIRVLDKLDADKNLVLSQWEIATAPAALRRLDSGHDGQLSAEECGFYIAANVSVPPDFVNRARRSFMRETPVLAALDADHDGEVSAAEIAASSSLLETLDRNRDGSLTPDELMPEQTATHAAMIRMRLDTNDDGSISASERAEPFRELLESADRNHDGVITRQELNSELSLRAERKRQFDNAKRAMDHR